MLIRKDHNFISCFNENTGEYIRSGIIENGKDTGVEPFMASFPELLDVGIMGHCIHGMNGLCMAAGVECYQDGLHRNMQNMSVEDFYAIVEQCKGQTYQIALGGCARAKRGLTHGLQMERHSPETDRVRTPQRLCLCPPGLPG